MPKAKIPHKKFKLKPLPREEFTPAKDKEEPTATNRRGYFPGANYSPLERAWLRAVERLQQRERRKFLSHVDYLRLAITLGWLTPPTTPDPRPKESR